MTLFQPHSPNARQQLQRWRGAGLAGIDEAGRGPLAGPVCAAAVVLPADFQTHFAQDSKKLSAKARDAAAEQIQADAVALGVGWADVAEIDAINILNATFQAMRRALQALQDSTAGDTVAPRQMHVLVDGNRLPPIGDLCQQAQAVIKGDALIAEIGAASIIAKVSRDRYMERLDERYPGYDFGRHKGYGTRAHSAALRRHGPCPEHRRSFAPVRAAAAARAPVAS